MIVQQAEDCDMIVMAISGIGGRRGLQRLVKGSVSNHVPGATRQPLLLVRPQEAIMQAHQWPGVTVCGGAKVVFQDSAGE